MNAQNKATTPATADPSTSLSVDELQELADLLPYGFAWGDPLLPYNLLGILDAYDNTTTPAEQAPSEPVAWRWKYAADQHWIYGEKLPKGDHWKPYKSLLVSEPLHTHPTPAPHADEAASNKENK
jgi:hypothetical protein